MQDELAYLRQRQESAGFNQLLGVRVRHIADGYAEIELPAKPENLNPLGNAHGGAIYALCDVAAGTAAASYGRVGVTLNASINYLRPGKKEQALVAKAYEIKKGRTTAVYRVEVTAQDDTLIADASFTMYYIGESVERIK